MEEKGRSEPKMEVKNNQQRGVQRRDCSSQVRKKKRKRHTLVRLCVIFFIFFLKRHVTNGVKTSHAYLCIYIRVKIEVEISEYTDMKNIYHFLRVSLCVRACVFTCEYEQSAVFTGT